MTDLKQPRQGGGDMTRWRSDDTLTRAQLFDWETRIDRDPHDLRPHEANHEFTYSVERGSGEDRQVLVEGVDAGFANALESAIYTLDSLIASARGEDPQ